MPCARVNSLSAAPVGVVVAVARFRYDVTGLNTIEAIFRLDADARLVN